MEEVVKIKVGEEEFDVTVGVITFEQWAELIDKYVKFGSDGKPEVVNIGQMGLMLVYYSIKRVEPKVYKSDKDKLKWVKKLPASESVKLYTVAMKINPLLG